MSNLTNQHNTPMRDEPYTHSPKGVNPNLFPSVDGFCYNQQFYNTPYYDQTHQLARLDALRRVAGNYQPKIYVINYELTGTTADNQPQFRIQMKPGSWIWGYAGYSDGLWFRVSDECTNSPLMSNWTPSAVLGSDPLTYQMPFAPNQVIIAPPVAVPEPGLVIVEIGAPYDATLAGSLCLLVAEPGAPYMCDVNPRERFVFGPES